MMKRGFDVIVSLFLLVVFAPLMAVIAGIVRWTLGSPVLFMQTRAGQNGRPFILYKFRTMTNKAQTNGELLPDNDRVTAFGNLLRKFSLDELPQLINVVKGDMSLVGPRPLLMEYLPLYTEKQSKRHHVRPGITGWAQVNGRNQLTWDEKFARDIWYVDHHSLRLDLKILALTLFKVLASEGVNQNGNHTMEVFKGQAAGDNQK